VGPQGHPYTNPYLAQNTAAPSVAPTLPNPFSPFSLRKSYDTSLASATFRAFGPPLPHGYLHSSAHFPRGPLLPSGLSFPYGPASSIQTLLAISAAQRPKMSPPPDEYQHHAAALLAAATAAASLDTTTVTASSPSPTPPEIDRRSSSIAALRLKARQHEIRLEQLRKNDLVS